MEILLTEEWLKQLYQVLIDFYKNTDDPIRSGFPIVTDYSPSMLNACVNRPRTKIFGQTIYPHVLQRAAISMHSIINFHPFVDGNKRMALISTYYYLLWNGYTLNIPYNADEFFIKAAKEHLASNAILEWLKKNTSRTLINIIHHWECETLSDKGRITPSRVFVDKALRNLFMPPNGFRYFVEKLIREHKKIIIS
jgi:death on curing protein